METGTVHPHVRGEYEHRIINGDMHDGSSPRAWGIPKLGARNSLGSRFIPTCVGNTTGTGDDGEDYTVHPHVRGEYDLCIS